MHGLRRILSAGIECLRSLDATFALAVTVRYFFHPLYRDYTLVGRILGVVFRSFRIAIAAVVYCSVIAFSAALIFVWAAIPLFSLWYGLWGMMF